MRSGLQRGRKVEALRALAAEVGVVRLQELTPDQLQLLENAFVFLLDTRQNQTEVKNELKLVSEDPYLYPQLLWHCLMRGRIHSANLPYIYSVSDTPTAYEGRLWSWLPQLQLAPAFAYGGGHVLELMRQATEHPTAIPYLRFESAQICNFFLLESKDPSRHFMIAGWNVFFESLVRAKIDDLEPLTQHWQALPADFRYMLAYSLIRKHQPIDVSVLPEHLRLTVARSVLVLGRAPRSLDDNYQVWSTDVWNQSLVEAFDSLPFIHRDGLNLIVGLLPPSKAVLVATKVQTDGVASILPLVESVALTDLVNQAIEWLQATDKQQHQPRPFALPGTPTQTFVLWPAASVLHLLLLSAEHQLVKLPEAGRILLETLVDEAIEVYGPGREWKTLEAVQSMLKQVGPLIQRFVDPALLRRVLHDRDTSNIDELIGLVASTEPANIGLARFTAPAVEGVTPNPARANVCRQLLDAYGQAAIPALLEFLLPGNHFAHMDVFLNGLARHASVATAAPVLMEHLASKDDVAETARAAIASYGQDALPFLVQALSHAKRSVRHGAVAVIGDLQLSPEALQELNQLVNSGSLKDEFVLAELQRTVGRKQNMELTLPGGVRSYPVDQAIVSDLRVSR